MSRLSETNRVLFIESLGLRQPTFQKKDVSRILRRLFSWIKGPRKLSENLFVFSPLILPFHKYRLVRAFNKIFLSWQLSAVVKKHHFDKPILWSYIPNAVEFMGKWGEIVSVYHCVDDLTANPLIPAEMIKKAEEAFLSKVNIVFTTSPALYENKKKHTPNTYYLPNVADFFHFNKAASSETSVAPEMKELPKPIIGFIGAISEYKLDFELIELLAKNHAEWSFVFIGETGEGEKAADLDRFHPYGNVHFHGGRPYPSLPGYLKAFDVCLLPSRLNEYTRNMFPMKFFEYLAAGKPVVSTALESIAQFREYYYPSRTHQEFESNILVALREKPWRSRSSARRIWRPRSWRGCAARTTR
jgi:glycosyltransferase involved in cell wall biosynthesis